MIERIKNLSNHVTVRGTWAGEMTLSVKTELVTTKTFFTELDVPQLDSDVQRNFLYTFSTTSLLVFFSVRQIRYL